MGQRTNVVNKIVNRIKALLSEKQSFTRHLTDLHSVNGEKVEYYMTLSMVDHETLSIHEIISPQKSEGFQDLFWLFKQKSDLSWSLESLTKNGTPGDQSLILRELYDLFVRINADESDNQVIKLEIPKPSQDFNRTFNPYIKRIYSYLYLLMGTALLVFGLFATLFVSNIQYNRMARIVNTLGLSISKSADGSESVIDSLAREITEISQEVDLLLESKEMEQEAFEFNRFNMSTSIRQRADSMHNQRQYSMKRAFYYIADRVEDSTSYGELYYHFTRLPENNSQAETLLATDRDNIISLNNYHSPISYFLYPVRLDGHENDGEGFMVSCGYMDMRLNPLGEGGGKPHYAADIININNIINISENSVMNRESKPGSIVSPAQGVILESNYSEVYGWFIEIEHPISEEVAGKYPGVERLTTFFAHMDSPSNWNRGSIVDANDKIGEIGNSGISTGPHLHYEIRIYKDNGLGTGYLGEKFDGIDPLIRS